MPKKQNLNLRNLKQMQILYTIAISEGRISKSQIMEQSNKEIFYRMKNNGFIKETAKGSGVFKATSKLQNLMEKTTGIAFGNGCSNKHSGKIGKSLTYIPKDVIIEGRFQSGQMLKREMDNFKQTSRYEKGVERLQRDVLRLERQIQNDYQNRLAESKNRSDRYQAGIDHRADCALCQMKKEVAFSDTPLFIPDFAVSVSRQEAVSILQEMERIRNTLPEGSKEAGFLEANEDKLKQMLQTECLSYNIYFEIITDSYGKPELERHQNYETVLNRDVLYIY